MPARPPVPPARRFSVLLAAWSLQPEASRNAVVAFAHRDAIQAFTRAVAGRGGELIMPADAHVVPLVANIALDYALGAVAETRGERPATPLVVMETEGRDDAIRRRLAPFAWRRAVTYLDVEGTDVSAELPRQPPDDDEPVKEGPRRHRMNLAFINTVRLRPLAAAVVVSPPADAFEELGVLRMADTVALGRTIVDARVREQLRDHDVTVWMKRIERWRHRDVGRGDPDRDDVDVMPYTYLAQVLAARWAEAGGPRR